MNEIQSYKPDKSLSPYISGYIYSTYKSELSEKPFFTPKGTAAIMIPLEINSNSYFDYPNNSSKVYFEKHFPYLFGLMSKLAKFYLKGQFEVFIIVFTPTGLFHFLDGPASQMTDKVMPLDQLGLPELHQKIKHLFESNTEIESCIDPVNNYLIDHFNSIPRKKVSEFIPSVIHQIHMNMGVVNLEEIVEQLGINNRTFQIHFKNQVGISPKLFCRIIRFNSLLFALDSSPTADILSFAIQFGYTDKPHLYKDFKQFLGMTPKEYKQMINNVNALVEKEVKKYFPE
ncbi:helix-turn-helix domain-containing protein [Aquiflexum sp. TKW24L]|uniref:helix-turn-helix domain-containing protein n=1 Tax=Aquiflexum sp. TKW24L TaxID=2942212 RepID=UPI0020BF0D30|nr:helix-turn-helix domain-containing protein [Aquiflexum sp. TKW24L]MCL6261732.1 helix-turn-helix domain-containing protein [Aquiflexum sp. TKW24L]